MDKKLKLEVEVEDHSNKESKDYTLVLQIDIYLEREREREKGRDGVLVCIQGFETNNFPRERPIAGKVEEAKALKGFMGERRDILKFC